MAKQQAKQQKSSTGGKAADVLAKLQENWNEAADNPVGDFTNWEPGMYTVKVTGAEVNQSGQGRWQVKWEFEDQEQTQEQKHYMFDGLDTEAAPQCLSYLRKHIEQMGQVPPKNMAKLEEVLKAIVEAGPIIRIQLKQNGEYLNTYIKGLVEETA